MVEQTHLSPYLYYLLIDVDPKDGQDYLKWLMDKHVQEVLACPGFLWVRRVPLEEPAADGWDRFMMVYGISGQKAFKTYRASDTLQGFMEEVKAFEGTFRITRYSGQVDFALD